MSKKKIKVGSRDSVLAMWQTQFVIERLLELTDQYEFEITSLKTKGDKILDVALSKIGDKGLFTKELEAGLLCGRIDFAVHSMKDMPTELPEGLQISSMLKRHNPADVLISERYASFAALPEGAKIGTSSLRRRAQLLHARPDLNIHDLRGNLQTRMRKMKEQNFDAIVLAAAGVERLGWQDLITEELDYEVCLPAVGQGVIGVETRSDDEEILKLVQLVNDKATAFCVQAERALQRTLEGGCQVPIGAYAYLKDDLLQLEGLVGSLDGKTIIRDYISGAPVQCEQLGTQLAQQLVEKGAQAVLDTIRTELNS